MPYTTLGSATAGQVYTASAHNAIIGNLNALGPGAFNVQSTTKTDVFTSTSTSLVDVTGLSVSITPSAATSKVLVIVSLSIIAITDTYNVRGAIIRGSTQIAGGTAAGTRPSATFATNRSRGPVVQTFCHLDSPATTSATTYKVQVATEGTAGAGVAVGRSDGSDGDSTALPRTASSITVIEVPV